MCDTTDSFLEYKLFLRALKKWKFAKQNIYIQESPCNYGDFRARPREWLFLFYDQWVREVCLFCNTLKLYDYRLTKVWWVFIKI